MDENKPNPLLTGSVLPGETFRLPSQGLFYTHGELSPEVKNGEIHVKAMTAIDELNVKSPDMLFTGKALEELFKRCIPQILKPTEMLSKDIDYLMVCLRMVTYGPALVLSYKHNCENAKDHTYEVDLQPIIRSSKPIDPTTMAQQFTTTMPNGQKVRLKPATIGAIIKLNQDVDVVNTMPSLDDLKSSVLSVLTDVIDSITTVDTNVEISDKALISEWVAEVSAGWIKTITEALTNVGDWGAVTKSPHVCRDCGEPVDIEFSTNPLSFFS